MCRGPPLCTRCYTRDANLITCCLPSCGTERCQHLFPADAAGDAHEKAWSRHISGLGVCLKMWQAEALSRWYRHERLTAGICIGIGINSIYLGHKTSKPDPYHKHAAVISARCIGLPARTYVRCAWDPMSTQSAFRPISYPCNAC